jgi:alpha-D-ribose 1-methylphosphonate 5-triphosphate synthase subunit PhnH
LIDMTPGFRDATHGAQQVFRTVLDAMSRPGQLLDLPQAALHGIVAPASAQPGRPMGTGMAAVLLTLLDAETAIHLAGTLACEAAESYLRFHTGALVAPRVDTAAFTAARASETDAPLWSRLEIGSDEVPQQGATLIVEVDAFGTDARTRLQLRGPGIQTAQPLAVSGLSAEFWSWRTRVLAMLPRGVDLILVCGARVTALPRTTRIDISHEHAATHEARA